MRKILKNSELNLFLLELLDRINPHYFELSELLTVLYCTGLRSEEVISLGRWYRENQDDFKVKTCKGSCIRTVKAVDLPTDFAQEVMQRNGRYSLINYTSMNYLMKKFMEGRSFYVGNKMVFTHLFRYNYIRQKAEKGVNFNQLVEDLGHREKQNTANYLTNIIEYE